MNLNNEINQIVKELNNKEFKKVINSCERIIQLKIENTIVYNLFGLGYQKQGLFEKSIKAFNKSIKLQDKNYLAINNLAVSLKAANEFKLSEKAYQECLKIKPDYPIAILNYANLKQETNDTDASIKLYLKALEFRPEINEIYVLTKLSDLYYSLGDFKKAKNYAEEIVKKNPNYIPGKALLSKFIDHKNDDTQIIQMEKIIHQKNLKDEQIIDLAFPLAEAYDSKKEYGKAFKYFEKGNNLKRKKVNYNLSNHFNLHNSLIKVFDSLKELNIVKKKPSKSKIIFICGMPRSGTTLIEQIISSHNQVVSTGENNFLSTYIKQNYLDDFTISHEKIIKDIYSKNNFFQDFIFDSLSNHNFKSQVFTDKSVQNFFWIGLIKFFIPNAKIIVTDRNSKDICLSIFKINFKNGFMNFAYNQKDIANFYNLYLDLISYWKEIFPNEIYTAKYENLIENPEVETKKLINFCQLDWDQNCLRHDKNKSAIKTASVSQARKPIYKSSVNLSDNYSEYLKDMFSLLKN